MGSTEAIHRRRNHRIDAIHTDPCLDEGAHHRLKTGRCDPINETEDGCHLLRNLLDLCSQRRHPAGSSRHSLFDRRILSQQSTISGEHLRQRDARNRQHRGLSLRIRRLPLYQLRQTHSLSETCHLCVYCFVCNSRHILPYHLRGALPTARI